MNQEKIGKFLKELRKQKGLTQEQIAEKFHVSNRTISRWENGNNMPDLDILIELSDYYEVGLQEIVLAYIIMKDASLYNNPTVVIGLDIVQEFAAGMLLVGLLYSSRYGARIRAFKHQLMKKQG